MIYLFIFALGIITDRYLFQIFDLYLQNFMNKQELETAKVQLELDRLANTTKLELADTQYEFSLIQKDINDIGYGGSSHAIGFNIDNCRTDDFDDFDDDEDYEDDI